MPWYAPLWSAKLGAHHSKVASTGFPEKTECLCLVLKGVSPVTIL